MTRDSFAAARNAVSNASRRPVNDAEIEAALRSQDGDGHVVRALFGDCAAETLILMAAHIGLASTVLEAAYALAKRKHLAANESMDAVVEGSLV